MNRIEFLKRLGIGLGTAVIAPRALGESLEIKEETIEDKEKEFLSKLDYGWNKMDGKLWYVSRKGDEIGFHNIPMPPKELTEGLKGSELVNTYYITK